MLEVFYGLVELSKKSKEKCFRLRFHGLP